MKINYMEEVQESVLLEYLDFKKQELTKDKEDIFNDYYEIHFYEEMSNYISSLDESDKETFQCLYKDKGSVLSLMYQYYLKNEYASINNYEDISDLVRNYNEKYHKDVLKKLEAEAE